MRSRVTSRATRTSPFLRRKPEISSAGDSAAIAGAASSKKPAVTPPTARCAIVPQVPIAHQTSAILGRFSIGIVDASRHGAECSVLGTKLTWPVWQGCPVLGVKRTSFWSASKSVYDLGGDQLKPSDKRQLHPSSGVLDRLSYLGEVRSGRSRN